MTALDWTTDVAVFATREAARAAADAAMPRRKHDRPYAQSSGWHWARAVPCPSCGAAEGVDCADTLHRSREDAARAAGRSADRWTVVAHPNTIMLRDGSMWDYQRKVMVRP